VLIHKYTEENYSKDLNFDIVRIFDCNPTFEWPPAQSYYVVGGPQIGRIPYVANKKTRPYFTDEQVQVNWYIVH